VILKSHSSDIAYASKDIDELLTDPFATAFCCNDGRKMGAVLHSGHDFMGRFAFAGLLLLPLRVYEEEGFMRQKPVWAINDGSE